MDYAIELGFAVMAVVVVVEFVVVMAGLFWSSRPDRRNHRNAR
jgi:hypothetical protein